MHAQSFFNSASTEGRSANMKTTATAIAVALALGACFAPGVASAFNSGSTGADGAFSPAANTTVTLPPSGIFNYTTVNIPAGVTVSYVRNTANTPVVILASGNVTIAGTLNVSGNTAPGVGAAGGGSVGDDAKAGLGGPGGFDGGRGGVVSVVVPNTANGAVRGGAGLGPGGGGGADFTCLTNGTANTMFGGAGGGYSSPGASSNGGGNTCLGPLVTGIGGASYGSSTILPLIGGSGGGGGSGGVSFPGAGGGGGGGAILIASSGTINVTGSILAAGGSGGSGDGAGLGGPGGGASGGAVRLVATTFSGNGPISAAGGPAGTVPCCAFGFVGAAGAGADGRVRLEAETFNRTAATTPAASVSLPGPVFVAGAPTLTISSVAGVSAPANPTGNADITLAATTPNPVAVVFTTSGVPVGNIVQLTVIPAFGPKITTVTPALTGSTASATASVSVNLPVGSNVLQAQTTFTVVAALGDLLRNFAGNERVEKIMLSATYGGKSKATLITVSGKEYEAPAEAMRIAALGAGR
jgi:hypothetical protein